MHGPKKSWLSLMLLLFALAIPMRARADYYWYSGGGGSTGYPDDGGDPDQPTPYAPKLAPGQHSGSTGRNDGNYQLNRTVRSDGWWARRYLMLLSGLRSYYLRF